MMKKTAQTNPKTKYITPKLLETGFTLIEVLVAGTILATLVGGVLLTLNPLGQINKSQDSQRMSDIQSVKTALDLYYNDKKCYPSTIPFGSQWSIGNTIYMKKVPQDPTCANGGTCYRYTTDSNNSCPQWNVVFAELSKSSALTNTCPLSSLSNCLPNGYQEGRYACVMQGAVDCSNLYASSLSGGIQSPDELPTATPTPVGPTPTPTPDPNAVVYTLPGSSNPDPYELSVSPLYPSPAAAQTVALKVADPGLPIQSVEVVVTSDGNVQHNFFLNPPTGTQNNAGTWTGTRQVGNQETFYNHYAFEFYIIAGTGSNQILGYEALPILASGK